MVYVSNVRQTSVLKSVPVLSTQFECLFIEGPHKNTENRKFSGSCKRHSVGMTFCTRRMTIPFHTYTMSTLQVAAHIAELHSTDKHQSSKEVVWTIRTWTTIILYHISTVAPLQHPPGLYFTCGSGLTHTIECCITCCHNVNKIALAPEMNLKIPGAFLCHHGGF